MIGVVGADTGAVTAALEASGTTPHAGPPESIVDSDPEAIVAVGSSAMMSLADGGRIPDAPVLAVDAGEGFPDMGSVPDAMAALCAGRYTTVDHPVLRVSVGGDHAGHAVFDAMVVTGEPGRISEFRITADADLGTVRADGIVVATPAGSHGYARSAGGPRLRPESGAAAVVPVAAFTMSPERWVVGLDASVDISSERSVPLSLLIDDRRTAIADDDSVTAVARESISLVAPNSTA